MTLTISDIREKLQDIRSIAIRGLAPLSEIDDLLEEIELEELRGA
jgi:hypothetical protein